MSYLFPFGHPWPTYFPWAFLALSNSVFPWVFTNSFGLPCPNYFILHPWGSWACQQPLTFFVFVTSGLLWPILTFLHHILPMGFSPGSFKPICFLKAHLLILWAYDPLFLPLGLNSFFICLLTLFCLCCWVSSFY